MSDTGTHLPQGAIKIDRGPHDSVIILDGTYAATVPKRLADAIEDIQRRLTVQSEDAPKFAVDPEDWSALNYAWACADTCERSEIRRDVVAQAGRVIRGLFGEPAQTVQAFDLQSHLQRQREWSERTFGPGDRSAGVVDHIRKELREIESDPGDLREWIDVVILALDGAWRSGASPEEIIQALDAKQRKNEAREWPDWRTADPHKAIEHVRGAHD